MVSDEREQSVIDQDTLVLLIGPSGSGKTTLLRELEDKGYNTIQSYTTRKPRGENEWGHIFLDEETMLENTDTRDGDFTTYKGEPIIALSKLYNGDYYFATESQYKGKGISLYAIDPEGERQLRGKFKGDMYNKPKIVTIFLSVCKVICKERMMEDAIRSAEEVEIRSEEDVERFRDENYKYIINAEKSKEEVINNFIKIIEKEHKKGKKAGA